MNTAHHLTRASHQMGLEGGLQAIVARLSPATLEALAEAAIDRLDALAGDADREPEPDLEDSYDSELDLSDLEDSFDRELDLSDMEPEGGCGAHGAYRGDLPAPVYGIDQSQPVERFGLSPLLDPVPHFECGEL